MPTTRSLTSTNLRSAFSTVVLSLSSALFSTPTAISAPQTPAPGLLVTPSAATLLVGESAAFSAVDDFDAQGNGVPFPWTVAVPNPEDIGLLQTDLFDHSPAAPLALREAEGCWVDGSFIAVEDGAPHGRASLVYFAVQ